MEVKYLGTIRNSKLKWSIYGLTSKCNPAFMHLMYIMTDEAIFWTEKTNLKTTKMELEKTS